MSQQRLNYFLLIFLKKLGSIQFRAQCTEKVGLPILALVSRARLWGRPKNSLVTVAHIPGPLPECWQSQSDRFAHFVTKQTTINRILLDILFEMKD